MQDGVHLGLEHVHVLANGDLMFLGFIPIGIKPHGEVMHLILKGWRRIGMVFGK